MDEKPREIFPHFELSLCRKNEAGHIRSLFLLCKKSIINHYYPSVCIDLNATIIVSRLFSGCISLFLCDIYICSSFQPLRVCMYYIYSLLLASSSSSSVGVLSDSLQRKRERERSSFERYSGSRSLYTYIYIPIARTRPGIWRKMHWRRDRWLKESRKNNCQIIR